MKSITTKGEGRGEASTAATTVEVEVASPVQHLTLNIFLDRRCDLDLDTHCARARLSVPLLLGDDAYRA